MPGLDYMKEENSNYWTDTSSQLFTWIGLEIGGGQAKKFLDKRIAKNITAPKGTIFVDPQGGASFRNPLQNKINNLKTARVAARHMSRIGRGVGVFGLAILGYELAKGVTGLARTTKGMQKAEKMDFNSPYESAFMDTRRAFTQRQRAIQVIHNSQLSTRAALGNEARYLHN